MEQRQAYMTATAALFVDGVGFSMLAPMLPTLQQRIQVGDVLTSLTFAAFSGGLLVGFIAGAFLHRMLRPRALLVGTMLVYAIADVVIALSSSAAHVGMARTTQGLSSGVLWITVVSVAMLSAPALKTPRLARVVAVGMAGTLLGPSMGLFGDLMRPFLLHAAILVVLSAVAVVTVRGQSERLDLGPLSTLRHRWVLISVLWIGLVATTEGMVHGSFPLLFGGQLAQRQVTMLYLALGLAAAVAAAVVARVMTQSRAERLVEAGSLTATIGLLLVALVTAPWVWLAAMIAIGAAVGVGESSALSLLGREQATGTLAAIVIYSQSWALGFLVGPPLGTALASAAGWSAPPVLILVCVLLLSIVLRVQRRAHRPLAGGLEY